MMEKACKKCYHRPICDGRECEFIPDLETRGFEIPKCELHCQAHGSMMCNLDGCISIGYEIVGCNCCPVFFPNKEWELLEAYNNLLDGFVR